MIQQNIFPGTFTMMREAVNDALKTIQTECFVLIKDTNVLKLRTAITSATENIGISPDGTSCAEKFWTGKFHLWPKCIVFLQR